MDFQVVAARAICRPATVNAYLDRDRASQQMLTSLKRHLMQTVVSVEENFMLVISSQNGNGGKTNSDLGSSVNFSTSDLTLEDTIELSFVDVHEIDLVLFLGGFFFLVSWSTTPL